MKQVISLLNEPCDSEATTADGHRMHKRMPQRLRSLIVGLIDRLLQLQADREKYAYDYDNLQSQLDKSQGQLSRVQKEKEAIQQELDRTHDKYDKHQVQSTIRPYDG